MSEREVLRVMHLVDALDAGEHLWGKERVVALLMREQRSSGRVMPMLTTFSPGMLHLAMAAEGFATHVLSPYRSRGFDRAVGALARALKVYPTDVIHSHGYRANIIARALRVSGRARGIRLISTAHGWVESTPQLRIYNAVDRWTSVLSDVMAVPDQRMLLSLPRLSRRRHVPNAVPDIAGTRATEGFSRPGEFVVGTLGRVSAEKGILEFLSAAETFADPSVVFTVAGAGELTAQVEEAGVNVRYVGYFPVPDAYLAGLDVYVQASHSEGLSLSLLEAMRAGKAIVATDVGATRDAITHGESGLVVPPRSARALSDAILALRTDSALRRRLGDAARARFESSFHIKKQHQSYLELYVSGGQRG